jgi:TonB family protein
MEAVTHPPKLLKKQEDIPVFRLWEGGGDRQRERKAGLASLLIHAALIAGLALMPKSVVRQAREIARSVTPLIAPPTELTQRAPNKGKVSKEINAEALLPRPRLQVPPSPPSTTRPRARVLALPSRRPAPGPDLSLPEAPRLRGSGKATSEMAQILPPVAPPPQIQPQERPKLVLESPAPAPSPSGKDLGQRPGAGSTISEAVRSLARRGGSAGLIVGDLGVGVGGIGEALNMPPSPGRQASNLELLSDPLGVDFRPYLIQILGAVRRNWYAVMPESAKLGRRGKVSIQFAISRSGSVPKLVIVTPSGTEALDRAAVAGISASNPFPPLPGEFGGEQVRLQFNFVYNMPSN